MKLEKGDKIHYVEYLDHGRSSEPIQTIREKPFVLWCSGKIVNFHHSDDPFYAIISNGTKNHERKEQIITYVLKTDIILIEEIYEIPN